jgi:hypothetical protein
MARGSAARFNLIALPGRIGRQADASRNPNQMTLLPGRIANCPQVLVAMSIQLAACALAREASAQSPSQRSGTVAPVGIWRGRSVCLVRPSACNDEMVVYRITQMKAADSVAIDARKIVRGEEQEMGVLSCRVVPSSGQLTCPIPQGVWHLRVHDDSLTGELRLQDNTRYRDVRTIRAPE